MSPPVQPIEASGATQEMRLSIQVLKLSMLLEQAERAILSNLVNAGILAWVLWHVAPKATLVAWLVAMIVLNLCRLPLNKHLKKRLVEAKEGEADLRAIENTFSAFLLVSGVLWGSVCVLLFPSESIIYQMPIALVLAGMCAGAVSAYAAIPRAAYLYLSCAVVPLIIRFAMQGTKVHTGLALMALLFTIMLIRITKELSDGIQNSMELRFELVKATRLATLGEIAANVAHEINNPLSIVLGRIDQLKEKISRSPDSERSLKYLASIEEAFGRIQRSVRSLLAFSDGDQMLQRRSVPVARVVESALRAFRARYGAVASEVEIHFSTAKPSISGDADLLAQSLFILLQNAQEALGSKGRISLDVCEIEREISLSVSDGGRGVEPEIEGKIFEPFFTTKHADRGKGTGLGLALAKNAVEKQGGTLRLVSHRAPTTFEIRLAKAA